MRLWRARKKKTREIHPDEIFIDSSNLPRFDQDQFEGRMERPLGSQVYFFVGGVLALLLVGLGARAATLQIVKGEALAKQAEDNQLREQVLFADRGVITDRTGLPLAYNDPNSPDEFSHRVYSTLAGLSHVVGYVKAPAKDAAGFYYRDFFVGMDGAEREFNDELVGQNGVVLTETDAHGTTVSQSTQRESVPGQQLTLSVDARVTEGLYDAIKAIADQSHFQGGSGVVIDVNTGEVLALTSYPEYSSQALSDGEKAAIDALNSDPRQPFLNRAVGGLYSPGSIIKPIVAAGALNEGVIDENKKILSTGSISLPNPYDPAHPSIFKDWRVNGWVDVRQAIAVSSDVYFYEVGGGFEGQKGMGIETIDKYLTLFGFGKPTGLFNFLDPSGVISNIAWKEEHFPGDPWRVGDTYHTAIGQYGTQVTPLQAALEAAALANGGKLLTPTLIASSTPKMSSIGVPQNILEIVREGMRLGVTDGIAQAVKFPYVEVAAKTGTAQVGMKNEYLNSWMIGFWPYEHPRYAYALVLERGPAGTLVGASAATAQFIMWLEANAPRYLAN